jgi:hypothetical protein
MLRFNCNVTTYQFSVYKPTHVSYRTPGDLFEELVKEGIIIRYPKLHLNEYVGEYSYLGTTLRQANLEPMPSISDVRRLVTEYAILPLGKLVIS